MSADFVGFSIEIEVLIREASVFTLQLHNKSLRDKII